MNDMYLPYLSYVKVYMYSYVRTKEVLTSSRRGHTLVDEEKRGSIYVRACVYVGGERETETERIMRCVTRWDIRERDK